MLPAVMRANYRKLLTPTDEITAKLPIFQGEAIDLNKVTDEKMNAYYRKLLKNGQAKVEYVVGNQAKAKTINTYSLTEKTDEYEKIYNSLRQNAVKQKQLLMDMIEDASNYPKTQEAIESALQITTSVLSNAVKKGWLKKNSS